MKLPAITGVASELNSVSMSGKDTGWAVGYDQISGSATLTGDYQTLIMGWNGAAWSTTTSPNPGTGTNLLIDVTSLSSSDAWAVGLGTTSPTAPRTTLAEHWNGTAWSLIPTQNVSSGNEGLLGVSGIPAGAALPSSDVWAVGYSTSPTTSVDQALAEHWNGSAWTTVPLDPATPPGVLTSVSMSSSNDGWAVGYTDAAQALVEHWNGSSWTLVSSPSEGSPVQILRKVVAISSTNAWAAGTTYDTSLGENVGFSESWNGSSWSLVQMAPSPNPVNDENSFQIRGLAVSAQSGTLWAAGGIPGTVAEEVCDTPSTSGTAKGSAPVQVASGRSPVASEPVSVSGRYSIATPDSVAPSADQTSGGIVTVDGAAAAGIGQLVTARTASIDDFAHNGLPSIFLGRFTGPGSLYLNQGNGTFEEVDQGTFTPNDRHTCVDADVDGNGSLDIFCTIGSDHANGLKANELWIEGPGTAYTNDADGYGLLDPTGRARAAVFLNATGSGRPDLFVANDPFRSDGLPDPNRLFVNTGHGFQDDPQLGLDLPIGANCATAGDYLRAGYDDLLVCPVVGPVRLFQNQSGQGFKDVTAQSGLGAFVAQDAVFGDLSGDGWPDIVLVGKSKLEVLLQDPSTHTFQLSYSLPLTAGSSAAIGDANGDGYNDIFVTQGAVKGTHAPNLLLLNNGSGTSFTSVPIPETMVGSGVMAYPMNFEPNGLTDFLVLNGLGIGKPAPLQLISPFQAPLQVSSVQGSGQSATVGQPFSEPLEVQVTDPNGHPVPGATVTFSAPSQGPSATFADGTDSEVVATNANGDAALTATANASPGSYSVTVSVSGGTGTATMALTNAP